jgi:large subunit ribosomal protein L13
MMKTFHLIKENVKRKWVLVDATDQIVGRLAGKISALLRGKHKPDFTPYVDSGEHVVVVNCEKIKMTGKKPEKKTYIHYTGYVGNQKKISFQRLLGTHPDRILQNAVRGMLPKNKLQDRMIERLKIYTGPKHPHEAQQPEAIPAGSLRLNQG